jgi:hypothetical protein
MFFQKFLLAGLAACAVTIMSLPADAQTPRFYMRGEFVPENLGAFAGGVDGDRGFAARAEDRLEEAHPSVSVGFAMEAWVLMGTPVQSCHITWDYRGPTGERLDEQVYIRLPQGGASLGLNDEALSWLASSGAIQPYQPYAGYSGFFIRRDALSYEPRLYDLDFWATMPFGAMRMDGSVPTIYPLRCLTGALGRAGEEDLNTPYAFDIDEVFLDTTGNSGGVAEFYGERIGHFLNAERSRQLFMQLIAEEGSLSPDEYITSRSQLLTDVGYDMGSVRTYLHGLLLEESRRARAYADAMQQRLREQQAEEAAAEARRQAANAAQATTPDRSGAITAEDRRYSGPPPEDAGSYSDIMSRVRALVDEQVTVRVPQARAPDPEPPAPNSTASVVLPGEPVTPYEVEQAIARAAALEESEQELAGLISNAGETAPRDMSRYADSIPDDPLANIEQHLYYENLFLRRVGDSRAYTRNGCSSPCRSELVYDFNAALKLSPDLPFEGCEANGMDPDELRRIGIGVNGDSFGRASYGPARGRANGQGTWNVHYVQLTFRCGDRERTISVDQIPAQPIPAAQCRQLLDSRELEEEVWWFRGGSQQYYDAVYNRAYGYCTDLLSRQ